MISPRMMQTHKTKARVVLAGILTIAASLPGAAFAIDTGLSKTAETVGYVSTSVPTYVGKLINGAMGALGIIFLILMFYGGMLWLTAEGEQEKIKKARGFIFHSILGLIITLFSYGIGKFVIEILAGAGAL